MHFRKILYIKIKIELNYRAFSGFKRALKAFIKPFEVPQRGICVSRPQDLAPGPQFVFTGRGPQFAFLTALALNLCLSVLQFTVKVCIVIVST